jgi:ribosomal protein L7/L12
VLDALHRGKTIEAIKRLRDATGLGLKEAKDAVEAYNAGKVVEVPRQRTSTTMPDGPQGGLPDDVQAALQRGQKIEAIKLLRQHTGLRLKETKDMVDDFERRTGIVRGRYAPGEVPRSGAGIWISLAALLLVVVLAYIFSLHSH